MLILRVRHVCCGPKVDVSGLKPSLITRDVLNNTHRACMPTEPQQTASVVGSGGDAKAPQEAIVAGKRRDVCSQQDASGRGVIRMTRARSVTVGVRLAYSNATPPRQRQVNLGSPIKTYMRTFSF